MDEVSKSEKRKKAFGHDTAYSDIEEIPQDDIRLMAAERLIRAKRAAKGLIDFSQFTMPDPNDPQDSRKSKYHVKRHHQALAAALEEMGKGNIKRLIISMPPRHGKTELCCVRFFPWFLGNFPGKHAIYATYNSDLAAEKGGEVRDLMMEPAFAQIFPDCQLKKGGKANKKIMTNKKNAAYFVGRGGAITGRGGDLIVVDDLFKNDEEANSPPLRNKVWKWFTKTVMNRFMIDEGVMILVMTRWHEDDVIGRLTDPDNPYYNETTAKQWDIVNIPAEAEPGDILGRKEGEALWPERFGLKYLHEQKALDSRSYSCLYQGNPTPDEGIFFMREWVKRYRPEHLDHSALRIYGSSDLSVGTKEQIKAGKQADRTAHLVWGVDCNDDIFLLDAIINRDRSDVNIEHMVQLMKQYKPLTWFTYQDQITGSIGPLLFKRMSEKRVYAHVFEHSSYGSKEQKAQPFKGRMAMGKVYFPKGRFWANDIVEELVSFPAGKNDDCVDACALFGQGMQFHVRGEAQHEQQSDIPKVGTLAWVKYSDTIEQQRREAKETGGF